ncbi:MAG: flagellar export chaperone FlgN [Phycisphaerales bacterium]|nr:flagellar export chaperone FlgN [Phycisphaerales bacterium]
MAGTWSNARGNGRGNGAAVALQAHEKASDWAPRLEHILHKQLELYRQLAALSTRQQALIAQDQTDGLMALLTDRQRVIDQISEVNREVEPFATQWTSLVGQLEAEPRQRLGLLLEELDQLVAEITSRDEQDRKVLESRRAEASDALDDVSRKRAALGAYGGPRPGVQTTHVTPRYQDRKG